MISARHSAWANAVFAPYVRRLMRRHFHAISLCNKPPSIEPGISMVFMPNHSTWWDGFFLYELNRQCFRRPFYLMMLERELQKFPFFRRLGAFSINPDSPKDIARSLAYARGIMEQKQRPAPVVCIFPQGVLLPWAKRPLGFKPGLERLVRSVDAGLAIVPVGIRCEFLGEQRPEVFIRFGEVLMAHKKTMPDATAMEAALEQVLASLQEDIVHSSKTIELLHGGTSVNRTIERLRGWYNPAGGKNPL